MTYEDAEALQDSARRFKAADSRLTTRSYAGQGEDPQLIQDAEEYMAARKAHQEVLERLES
jgi:hypothetical protein